MKSNGDVVRARIKMSKGDLRDTGQTDNFSFELC